jgi:hypothetical protein
MLLLSAAVAAEPITLPLDVPLPYETRASESPFDLVDRPNAVYLVRPENGRILAQLPVLELDRVLEGLAGQPLDGPLPRSALPAGVESVEGWPFALPEAPSGSPAVGDLDGDGRAEIVVSLVDGRVYVLDVDGTVRLGWPHQLGAPIRHGPRLADIDGDGRVEIVVVTESGFAHALGLDSGRALPGWPVCLDARNDGEQVWAAPTLADLHPHHGLEVVLVGTAGTVQVFGADGVPLPGWPVRRRTLSDGRIPASYAPAAAGDLDGDGVLEVVVGWDDGQITAYDPEGRLADGWPRVLPNEVRACFGPVWALDLDGGGGLEVVVATDRGLSGPPILSVLRQDGRTLPPWPVSLSDRVNGGAAVADIDGDGVAELLTATVGGTGTVTAWGRDGIPSKGWPRTFPEVSFDSGVVVAQLTPDPGLEIVALGSAVEYGAKSLLYVLTAEGKLLPGFPIAVEGTDAYAGGVTACDLEGDGLAELVVTRGGSARLDVYRFPAGGPRPWFRSDLGNDAVGQAPPASEAEDYGPPLAGAARAEEKERLASALEGDLPGSLRPETTFRFLLPETADVRLQVLDVRGRSIRTMLGARLPTGFYAVSWDGMDESGEAAPTGVFFFELSVDGDVRRKQLVLSLR